MRRRLAGIVAVLFVVLLVVPARSAAAATALPPVTCGWDISQPGSYVLNNNLDQCPASGITISSDNVSLDLRGHRLSGQGSQAGISTTGSRVNVVVRNGSVVGFSQGIVLWGDGATIEQMDVGQNGDQGIIIDPSDRALVQNNVVSRNDDGIVLLGVTHAVVAGNDVTANINDGIVLNSSGPLDPSYFADVRSNRSIGNMGNGLSISGGGVHRIRYNETALNALDGVAISDSGSNKILTNRSIGNGSAGFRNSGASSTNNTYSGNRGTGNHTDGFAIQDGSVRLTSNIASANSGNGIDITGGSGHALTANAANENGSEGIYSTVPATLNKNVANSNSYPNGAADNVGLGIDAASSSGSANHAAHNDSGPQCFMTSGCVPGPATPPPHLHSCGDTITHSEALHNNLDGCSGRGLAIGKAGITLSLGAHRIAGSGTNAGIDNAQGYRNVTITGGVVTNFKTDVVMRNGLGGFSNGGVVTHVYASSPGFASNTTIAVSGRGVRVTRNVSSGSGIALEISGDVADSNRFYGSDAGITAPFGGVAMTFSRNRMYGVYDGIVVTFGSHNFAIVKNVLRGTADKGIFTDAISQSTIGANRIDGAVTGMLISSGASASNHVAVVGNVIRGCDASGIELDTVSAVRVLSNVVTSCDDDGVYVHGATTNVLVKKNITKANGVNGIDTNGGVKIVANTANRNGFLAAPAQTPGTGLGISATTDAPHLANVAVGNDAPAQCFPAYLC